MTKHAILPPSSAYRWLKCPASEALIKYYTRIDLDEPDEPSEAALEGTRLHGVIEKELNKVSNDYKSISSYGTSCVENYIGQIEHIAFNMIDTGIPANNRIVVNAILAWSDFMRNNPLNDPERIDIPSILRHSTEVRITNEKFETYISGTIDLKLELEYIPCSTYLPSYNRLFLIDFKFGKYPVGDSGIQQLRTYVSLTGKPIKDCTALIIQPQCSDEAIEVELIEGHDEKCLKAIDGYKNLLYKVELGLLGPEDCFEGAHCRFCPVYTVCPLKNFNRHEKLLDRLDVIEPEKGDPMKLSTTDELVKEYIEGKELIKRLDSIEKELTKRLENGEEHEKIMLKCSRSKPKAWVDESLAESTMLSITKDSDALWTHKLKSPTQFEAYLKENFSDNLQENLTKIKPHVKIEPGKVKLTIVE